jgi:hypothetical protein
VVTGWGVLWDRLYVWTIHDNNKKTVAVSWAIIYTGRQRKCCLAVDSTQLKYDGIVIIFHTLLLFRYKMGEILDETVIFTDKQKVMFTTQVSFSFRNVFPQKARRRGGARFLVSNKQQVYYTISKYPMFLYHHEIYVDSVDKFSAWRGSTRPHWAGTCHNIRGTLVCNIIQFWDWNCALREMKGQWTCFIPSMLLFLHLTTFSKWAA